MLLEVQRIEHLKDLCPRLVTTHLLGEIEADHQRLPLLGVCIGARAENVPVFGLFGGVHGLERVGCHVALSWLESMCHRLIWDEHLQDMLARCRIVSMPLINPGGLFLGRRSNPAGVDLMRNAPVDSSERTSFLVGGHRIGNWLPWYRGDGTEMEPETQALVKFIEDFAFVGDSLLTIDCHSGFGLKDRIWFPYARSRAEFPAIESVIRIEQLIERAHPHHPYIVEPQSLQYTTHGDLWDYLYDRWCDEDKNLRGFVPLTLEMGSWSWVRKNPRQLFSQFGPFNPTIPHRYRRTMRRHLFLLDMLLSLSAAPQSWQ